MGAPGASWERKYACENSCKLKNLNVQAQESESNCFTCSLVALLPHKPHLEGS